MFVGRANELKFLENYYNRKGSSMVVFYGRQGIGKTELLRLFAKNKQCIYYYAAECSEKEQKKRLAASLGVEENSYEELFSAAVKAAPVLIIDEFNNGVRQSQDFMTGILSAMAIENDWGRTLVILASSSVSWVENDMVRSLGRAALSISALLKLKELNFMDIMTRFPEYSVKECVTVYGILGGVPAYLNYWNKNRSVKENIMALFLHKDGRLYREAEDFLKTELRELPLYNTILAYLAAGKNQLNELYEETGFSRAKISVYIKNLIEMDIVEKVFSYDTKGKENTQKGLYRIKDTFLLFWYRFVFPNLSELESRQIEEVYDKKIRQELEKYLELSFIKVCQEYMQLLSDYKKLDFAIEQQGSWFGKEGRLDLLGQFSNGSSFAGGCKWSPESFSEEDFMKILYLSEKAKVEPDYYYLFSQNGFASSMEVKAKGMDNVILMDLEDM